jgi:hypothetical protein
MSSTVRVQWTRSAPNSLPGICSTRCSILVPGSSRRSGPTATSIGSGPPVQSIRWSQIVRGQAKFSRPSAGQIPQQSSEAIQADFSQIFGAPLVDLSFFIWAISVSICTRSWRGGMAAASDSSALRVRDPCIRRRHTGRRDPNDGSERLVLVVLP